MSEQLENFIQKNKKEFDVFEPSDKVWEQINNNLDTLCKEEKKRLNLRFYYGISKIAAVFLLILGFGFAWGYYKNTEANKLENISPEYAAIQVQFTSLIKEKRSELKDLKKVDPNLYADFKSAQSKLENSYNDLKKELANSPNQDKVIKAMIRNLQLQIALLNQQLSISEDVKQIKLEENEKSI